MGYKVIGFFEREDGKRVKDQLKDAGFNDVDYSRNKTIGTDTDNDDDTVLEDAAEAVTGDYDRYDYSYREDDRTRGFWDKMFDGDDDNVTGTDVDRNRVSDRDVFSRVASRADMITVHVDTDEEVKRVQDIMDNGGAIDPHGYDQMYSGYRNRYRTGGANITDRDTDFANYRKEWNDRDMQSNRNRYRSRAFNRDLADTDRLRDDRSYEYSTYRDDQDTSYRRGSWDYTN